MTAAEMREKILALGPWFYEFDLENGVHTATSVPPTVTQIFQTRLGMLEDVVERHFGSRLAQISCIDIGCHEGFYSIAMARKGVRRVLGVDLREANLRKARFVSQALGIDCIRFEQGNCEQLGPENVEQHELSLCLGLLYHLENPMLCLRNVSRITKELCVIETQVIDEVEGSTEWGSREWTRPYQGVLAVIDESGEFCADNTEAGNSSVGLCPSRRALIFMLQEAGFKRTEILQPQADAYEQHRRGKRIMCAAYK